MKQTAVIYARFSSHGQTEQSIEGQLRECYEYAKRNNLIILSLEQLNITLHFFVFLKQILMHHYFYELLFQ